MPAAAANAEPPKAEAKAAPKGGVSAADLLKGKRGGTLKGLLKDEKPTIKLGINIVRISLPAWRPASHIGRPKNIVCVGSSKAPHEAGKGKKEFTVCAVDAKDQGPRLSYLYPGSLGEPAAWVDRYKEGRDLFITILDKDTPLGQLGTIVVKQEDFYPGGLMGYENRSGDIVMPKYPIENLAWEDADTGAYLELEICVEKSKVRRKKQKGLSPEEEARQKLKNDLQALLEKRARDWKEKPPERVPTPPHVEERKAGVAPATRVVNGIGPVTGPGPR
eukprot:TRINITY_DN74729_c0_g1_i1.p2 TRINITY_DN74729_c0_g1~~TRINITY_DN74729_c0_g1_i1.p2  ORF type:complete len:276 (-),score=77.13 TRINITY_DN74729_c0_g1_i1:161-988(-)